MDVTEGLADLLAEQEALDVIVAPLTAEQLALPTPSPRWTVADQLAHLTYFDNNAALAIEDPDAFPASIAALFAAAAGGDEGVDEFVLGQVGFDRLMKIAPTVPIPSEDWRGSLELLGEVVDNEDGAERLIVSPSPGQPSPLTDAAREHIRTHRWDLIAFVKHRAAVNDARNPARSDFSAPLPAEGVRLRGTARSPLAR